MSRYFKNKKTGNVYKILHEAIECTNGREHLEYMVYVKAGDIKHLGVYVRDKKDFMNKFFEVKEMTTTTNFWTTVEVESWSRNLRYCDYIELHSVFTKKVYKPLSERSYTILCQLLDNDMNEVMNASTTTEESPSG